MRTLRQYQIDAVVAITDAFRYERRVVLVLPTGCHAKGQGVFMRSGAVKAVEDVKVGDLLLGFRTGAQEVLSLCRGRGRLVKIAPANGRPFIVNEDHVLTLMRRCFQWQWPDWHPSYFTDVSVREWEQWPVTKQLEYTLVRDCGSGVEPVGFRVEEAGHGDYYGFTLDGDGRYLLDDFTATHNSGKTCCFARIARDWEKGRTLVLAHRDELIGQAAKKLYDETGEWPAIEQGAEYANEGSEWGRSQYVVASVQSLHRGRLTESRFNDIGLVVVDEAHRFAGGNLSYERPIAELERRNPDLRILLVTATPKRKDGRKLIADCFAYTYTLREAIDDGWLVPIRNKIVVVKGLDFSRVKSLRGDLNQAQLQAALEEEGPLHEIASITEKEAGDLQTVVFCASVAQAEKTCEIINRIRPASALWLSGDQGRFPKPVRRDILRQFADGEVQFLCNMGVLVEGWDCPTVGMIAMARPTKSATVYSQALGRGTRPLDGLVDQPHLILPEQRRQAIAESTKPWIKVLDFVDQSRRHNLVTSCDPEILGGRYTLEEIDEARKAIEEKGEDADVDKELAEARDRLKEQELEEARQRIREREEAERREAERRKHIVADVDYVAIDVDTFSAAEKGGARTQFTPVGKPVTEKQAKWLHRVGINPNSVTRKQAQGIIAQIVNGTFKYPKKRQASPKPGSIEEINRLLLQRE